MAQCASWAPSKGRSCTKKPIEGSIYCEKHVDDPVLPPDGREEGEMPENNAAQNGGNGRMALGVMMALLFAAVVGIIVWLIATNGDNDTLIVPAGASCPLEECDGVDVNVSGTIDHIVSGTVEVTGTVEVEHAGTVAVTVETQPPATCPSCTPTTEAPKPPPPTTQPPTTTTQGGGSTTTSTSTSTTTTSSTTTSTTLPPTTTTAPNQPPVADARIVDGPKFYVGDDGNPVTFQLNGGHSYDNDGSVVVWSWTGAGSSSASNPSFTRGRGVYRFCLSVKDDDGAWNTNEACVTVEVVEQYGG